MSATYDFFQGVIPDSAQRRSGTQGSKRLRLRVRPCPECGGSGLMRTLHGSTIEHVTECPGCSGHGYLFQMSEDGSDE